jgi:hypothetical protein
MWNKILALLDAQFGFQSNKASSKVKKIRQGYDNQTNEHVIWLEYRVRVRCTAQHRRSRSDAQRILTGLTNSWCLPESSRRIMVNQDWLAGRHQPNLIKGI